MIHENDIGRVDLSPDYLTLYNRYFIRETSLRAAILGEKTFGVASSFHTQLVSSQEIRSYEFLLST